MQSVRFWRQGEYGDRLSKLIRISRGDLNIVRAVRATSATSQASSRTFEVLLTLCVTVHVVIPSPRWNLILTLTVLRLGRIALPRLPFMPFSLAHPQPHLTVESRFFTFWHVTKIAEQVPHAVLFCPRGNG